MENGDFFKQELYSEIANLKKENAVLKRTCSELESILKQHLEVLKEFDNNISLLKNYSMANRFRIESLPFEIRDPDYELPYFKPNILSIEETRKMIISGKKSIGRFGDGEFGIIEGIKRWNFQGVSNKLKDKLLEVLKSSDDGFLVGLNEWFYSNLSALDQENADGIRSFMTPERRELHSKLLKKDKVYGNLNIHRIETSEDIQELKQIWDKKDIVIIEGQYTRMGVGNDLLDSCKSIERIIAPAENAIDRYDDIMSATIKQSKNKTILLALGPTATALAYDLFKERYHAIDIGHIDLIYEKYLHKAGVLRDLFIPYKYCTVDEEAGFKRDIDDIKDEKYEEQIVAKVY